MNRGKPSILPSLLCFIGLLGAMGCMLLPLLKTETAFNETIEFSGVLLLFGGTLTRELGSGVYSFTFNVNVYLLIVSQGFLLSAISCLLGRMSRFNRVFSLALGLASVVALCFAKRFVALSSPIAYDGLEFHYGFSIGLSLAIVSLIGEVIALSVFDKKPQKKEKARKNAAELK